MTRRSIRTTTGCHTAQAFDELRRRQRLNASFERALACHLAAPCSTCLRRLHSLPPLVPEGLGPAQRSGLLATESALIRALRTLGGWPPARWLQVERRRAVDGVGLPLGFLRLVLEEARFTQRLGQGVELPRWVEIIQQVAESAEETSLTAPWLARALCYLAQAEHGRRRPQTARELLERASRTIDGLPRDHHLAALGFETYAVIVSLSRREFSEGQFELAAGRVAALDRRRWAEIRLRQARAHLDHGFRDTAIELADRATEGLGDTAAPWVLRLAQQVHALAARQAMSEAKPGLRRLLRAADFAASMEPLAPIGPEFDAELSHETASLLHWLDDAFDQFRPFRLRKAEPTCFDSPFDEALYVVVLAALDHETPAQHRQRLNRLLISQDVLQGLAGLRPEAEATQRRTAGVRGVPESLGPVVELLRRLERGT